MRQTEFHRQSKSGFSGLPGLDKAGRRVQHDCVSGRGPVPRGDKRCENDIENSIRNIDGSNRANISLPMSLGGFDSHGAGGGCAFE